MLIPIYPLDSLVHLVTNSGKGFTKWKLKQGHIHKQQMHRWGHGSVTPQPFRKLWHRPTNGGLTTEKKTTDQPTTIQTIYWYVCSLECYTYNKTRTRIFTQIHTHNWGIMGLKKKVTEENISFISTFNNFRVCLPEKEHSYINKNIQEQFHCNLIFVYMVSHDLCLCQHLPTNCAHI